MNILILKTAAHTRVLMCIRYKPHELRIKNTSENDLRSCQATAQQQRQRQQQQQQQQQHVFC